LRDSNQAQAMRMQSAKQQPNPEQTRKIEQMQAEMHRMEMEHKSQIEALNKK
jgi:hypothetical protein